LKDILNVLDNFILHSHYEISQSFLDDSIKIRDLFYVPDVNSFLAYAYQHGFVTLENGGKTARIPNEEIRIGIVNYKNFILFNGKKLSQLVDCLTKGEVETFDENMKLLLKDISYHDAKESFYHGTLYGLFWSCAIEKYKIESNREEGNGRFDIKAEIREKEFGRIDRIYVEVNHHSNLAEKAKEAFDQIIKKKYFDKAGDNDSILAVGICFYEKNFKLCNMIGKKIDFDKESERLNKNFEKKS